MLAPCRSSHDRCIGCVRLDSESFPQLTSHAPADLKCRIATAELHEVLAVVVTSDCFQIFDVHERIAMNANKRRTELVLERAQRIFDQILALEWRTVVYF